MQIFSAKYIFDGTNLLENKAIIVEDGIISEIICLDKLDKNSSIENYGNQIIAPGFIDLQLNGCGGVLFNDDISHNTLEIMYNTCLKYGTTSFLPTLITSGFNDVIMALETVKSWFAKYGNTRGAIGIHLEGPFISSIKKGIHPEQFITKPSDELLTKIVSYTSYFPIMMTIAPEVFTKDQIKFLVKNKIVLSIGHSNASYEEAKLGIESGIIAATHTFNAMSGLTGRNPGVIASVFNHDIYNGVIADMLHVDRANIQILTKIKPEKTFLVTDAVTPMGTDITTFTLGGKTLFVKDGKCIDENGVIGGAYLTMPEAVTNCVKQCHIDLLTALNMASLIPAKLMGYQNLLGKIARGFRADLITFDIDNTLCTTINSK